LPPAYFTQIALLQDRVPPFPCDEAFAAMEAAFGQPPSAVFSAISDKPVAAASLGQVYRATLRDGGGEVAVKVLRPHVLEQVGLDLYLMRNAGASFNATKRMNTDWVGVIDEWALRFFAEMDYEREARNGARLAADLSSLPGVLVPAVVPSLSTGEVLTTVWIEGEKLSESNAADVRTLCSTLLNAYLIQVGRTERGVRERDGGRERDR
jgi:aarF domain-containing kinase